MLQLTMKRTVFFFLCPTFLLSLTPVASASRLDRSSRIINLGKTTLDFLLVLDTAKIHWQSKNEYTAALDYIDKNGQKQSVDIKVNCRDKKPQRTRDINRTTSAIHKSGASDKQLLQIANEVCPRTSR